MKSILKTPWPSTPADGTRRRREEIHSSTSHLVKTITFFDWHKCHKCTQSLAPFSGWVFLIFFWWILGHGPRNCIGKRFAMLQNKMAFIRLVANYKLVACEKTAETLKMDPSGISGDVLGGVWIKCVKRDTDSVSGVADSWTIDIRQTYLSN